jgi:hypothetical protein
MSISNFEINLSNKITLALKNLYVEIKSNYEKEDKEKIRQIEFKKLEDINPFDLIMYIKEAVDIYANFVKEEYITDVKEKTFKINSESESVSESESKILFDNIEFKGNKDSYEDIIRNLEESKRNFIKVK